MSIYSKYQKVKNKNYLENLHFKSLLCMCTSTHLQIDIPTN